MDRVINSSSEPRIDRPAGTHKVRAAVCDLSHETQTHNVLVYTVAVFSIAVVFVALRVAGKMLAKRLSMDDYIIVGAMLLTAIPFGCILASKT
jgi:hypothetical protein